MTALLQQAGESFLRAFASSLVFLIPGLLVAPSLGSLGGLALAALVASVVAGLKVVQVFVPQISFASLIKNTLVAELLDSFTRAFLGTFITLVTSSLGVLHVITLTTVKDLLLAAIIGAGTAGLRALQGLLTIGEEPVPAKGLKLPVVPVKGVTDPRG
jgi:hypothetical protein